MDKIEGAENQARMLTGELYHAFVPDLIAKRHRCSQAYRKFNHAEGTRRELVELWRDIIDDRSPLPPLGANEEEEFILLQDEAYIDGPIKIDYGNNLKLGKGVNINCSCTFLDTCLITIGARTLIGPNCSFYSARYPLDPFLRNGVKGPELGAPITIGEDCWFGGSTVVCPGVNIGRGVTVGAGSIVTKDVPDFHVVAGNPARIIRKIETKAPDPALVKAGDKVIIATERN